jgi:protocadherin-16/23
MYLLYLAFLFIFTACDIEPVPQLTVIAKDNGYPQLSSTSIVLVTIHDVNDNEPIFDQSFYNATVGENDPKGRCILKVRFKKKNLYTN